MARKYSDEENTSFKRVVEKNRAADGKVDWKGVTEEISLTSKKTQTVGAIKVRYSRLMSQGGVKRSSRAGEKTLERTVKWLKNLMESNRRNSGCIELLKKENKELLEENKSLKKELKSHGPILKWYIRAQEGFKIATAKKALFNKE